jgi:hypothetical protein
VAVAMSETWDESARSDGMSMAGSAAQMVGVVSSGAEGVMPNTARPAASKVRNSSKDERPADGGWEVNTCPNVVCFDVYFSTVHYGTNGF